MAVRGGTMMRLFGHQDGDSWLFRVRRGTPKGAGGGVLLNAGPSPQMAVRGGTMMRLFGHQDGASWLASSLASHRAMLDTLREELEFGRRAMVPPWYPATSDRAD